MRPIKILLAGPGLIGKKHARLLSAQPRCEFVGIAAPDIPENLAFAREMGVPTWASFEEAIVRSEAEAVIISSPNDCHFEQAMSCVRRGLPALVEKPITDNLDDARRLVEASEQSGVPLLVGHHRAYSPLLDAATTFLRSSDFGRMVAMQGSALFYKPAHYFADGPWRTRIGGGPILINLIHEIGLMRHFCGEIASIFAMASSAVRQFEVEDTVAVSLQFESGAVGSFLLSDTAASNKSWEMTSGENPAYPHFPADDCYHFAGTHGSLDFPSMNVRTYGAAAVPSWWVDFESRQLAFERADPLARQLEHFLDVLQTGCSPRVTARDGYMNMLVVQAIAQSVQTRAVVDLADVV